MRLLLEVDDRKAHVLLAILKKLPFVRTKEISPAKARKLGELKMATDEMNDVLQGKSKARDIDELLNEL
jgi:hypothetical protein